MPSPLPILIGVGLMFLIASGNASAATPKPGPAGPSAYDKGYTAGYADGLAGVAKAGSPATLPAAVASGNPADFAKGYDAGYTKGTADKPKPYTPPKVDPVKVDPKTACVGPGVTMSILEAQEILTARGFYKGVRDGVCNATMTAALLAYQTNKMLLAMPGMLDVITEAALRSEPVSTPEGFKNATASFDDGLNYKTAKSTNAEYMKWFNNGRYVRGYQDGRIFGPSGEPYPSVKLNPYYMQGWNDYKSGQPDITSTKFPY